jgi:hypothetical protein
MNAVYDLVYYTIGYTVFMGCAPLAVIIVIAVLIMRQPHVLHCVSGGACVCV